MSVVPKLASSLGRNDEAPNQALAADIARRGDRRAVKELIKKLNSNDTDIQNDCIKVLYEVGERKPELIAPFVSEFLDLLSNKNNRITWGAMTALGTIAALKADTIWTRVGDVMRANDAGSVITQDWGIRVLAAVSSKSKKHEQKIFPYLLAFLKRCIPRDVPKHAESMAVAVNRGNRDRFIKGLKARERELKPSQMARVRKIYRKLGLDA